MKKIKVEIKVPEGDYCENANNVCPMCLEGNWAQCYCCLFDVDLEPDDNYYCKRCEKCKQAEVEND